MLTGVGHFPQVERPTEVVDLIDDFISRERTEYVEQPVHLR